MNWERPGEPTTVVSSKNQGEMYDKHNRCVSTPGEIDSVRVSASSQTHINLLFRQQIQIEEK